MRTNRQLEKWIKEKFSGHGAALRHEGDRPTSGEPFMSMEVAKRIAREAYALDRPNIVVLK